MQPNALSTCQKHAFFLLSSFNGTPAPDALSVFYKVETEVFAKDICDALARVFGQSTGGPEFHYVAAATLSPADQEHFHIAFSRFEFSRNIICSEACLSAGTLPPPEEMKMRVQYAVYAQEWEKGAQARASQGEAHNRLMQFAQTYYTVLESVIGCPDPVFDLELNTAYRLVIKNIKRILRDYECLRDFPMRFEPVVPNLCPMTLCNLKWKDVALDVQVFLGTVHEYVTSNGKPKPDSAVEDCTLTVKMAAMYSKRMAERAQKKADPASPRCYARRGAPRQKDAHAAAKRVDTRDQGRRQRFRPLSDDFGMVEMDGGTIDLRGREKVKLFLRLLWSKDAKCCSKAICIEKRFGNPSSLFRPGGKFIRQDDGTDKFVVNPQGQAIHCVYKNAVGIVPSAKKGSGATKYYLKVFKDSATS